MEEVELGLLEFAQLLGELASPTAPDAFFRLLDTVLFLPSGNAADSRPVMRWYYTTKTGSIAQKRREHVSMQKVIDRFAKFALANPYNSTGVVGRLMTAGGNQMLLNKQQLQSHLGGLWHGSLLTEPVAVQVYLRPQNGKEAFVEAFSSSDDGQSPSATQVSYTGVEKGKVVPDAVKQQVVQASDQLYAALSSTTPHLIRTRFVVDDNGQAWIAGLFLQSTPVPSPAPPAVENTPSDASTGPQQPSPNRGKRPSTNPPLRSDRREQLEDPNVQATRARAVNSAGAVNPRTRPVNELPAPGWPEIEAQTISTEAVEQPVMLEGGDLAKEKQTPTHHQPRERSAAAKQRNGKLQPGKELQRRTSPYVSDQAGTSSKQKSRRKGLEPGPNLELLAQFAAEKQRAMQVMAATAPIKSPKQKPRAQTSSQVEHLERLASDRLAARGKTSSNQLDASMSYTSHEEAFMSRLLPNSPAHDLETTVNSADTTVAAQNRELQLQVELLEAKLKVLEQKLEDAHQELADALEKSRDTVRQLNAARSEHERKMAHVQSDHQSALLEAHEAANRKMAEFLSATQTSVDKDKSTMNITERTEAAEAQATAQYQRLREQLQHAQQELIKAQQEWAKERKAVFGEFNSKLVAQEQRLRAELSGSKSSIATLEDVLAAKDDQIAELKQQLVMATRREADVQQRAQTLEQEQNRLQGELKAMQQSVAASTRIELARGIHVDDPKAAIRAVEAKAEAKVRQLNNKLEFLKAQVTTEQTAREELEKALENSRRKVDEVRDEQRVRLQEAEQRNQDAIQEVEDNLRRQYEERMMELTTIQTKMSMVQNQMQEALQDSAAAKHKEESVRATANRLEVQLMAARRDIEQYRQENDEMRQTLQEHDQRQASQASTDATIRRLDNERQYLRSQLTSEITHKTEIQESLVATQQQLVETKAQWEHDVHTLREQSRMRTREHENTQVKLLKEKNDLESSSLRFERQATELREGYTKLREQLRGREDDMDALAAQYRKLQEELNTTKDELVRQQKLSEQYQTRAQENVSTVQASMEELLAQKRKEVKELQTQLAAQFATVSSLQRDMLAQHHAQQDEKHAWGRQRGAIAIVATLQQCLTRNTVRRLGRWKMFTTQTVLKELMQGVMKRELGEAHEQAHKQREAAVKQCATQMKHEQRLAMEASARTHNEAVMQLRATLVSEREQALQQQHEEFVRLASEQDQTWQDAASVSQRQFDETQAMMLEDQHRRLVTSAERAESKLQQLTTKHQGELDALQQSLQTSEKEISALHADIELLRTQHQEAQAQLQADHDSKVQLLKLDWTARHEAALATQRGQLELQQAQALENAEQEKLAAVEAECAAGRALLQEELQQVAQAHEDQLRALRAEFDEREKMLMTEHENKAAKLVEEREQQLLQQQQQAAEAMREASFAERAQAVAVEAAKWKRTLKEADARFQTESKHSYEKGVADATARMELQLQQALAECANDLARHQTAWEQDRAALVQEHKNYVTGLVAEKEAEKLEAVRQAEAALLMTLQASHDAQVSQMMEELDKKHRADIRATEEAARLKQEQLEVQWQLERQTMEQIQDSLKQQMAQQSTDHQAMLQEMQDRFDAQQTDFDQAQQDLLRAHAKALEAQQSELEELKLAEFEEFARKSMNQHRQALAERERELQAQHQQNLSDVENLHAEEVERFGNELTHAKGECANLEQQLQEKASALQDAEQSILQLERELSATHKDSSIVLWRLLATGKTMAKGLQQKLVATQKEGVAALAELQEECTERLNQAKSTTTNLAAVLQQTAELQIQMKNVLVSHKADILTERRRQIQALEGEVQEIIDERGDLLDNKALVEEETEKLEAQVAAMEDEIRDHSKFSSVQNGRVNVAHARKKRRLDEDLERLLEQIEHKRAEIASIDAKLGELSDRQDEREAESVRMEQELVQVLIEQQKLLLGLLAECKDAAERGSHLVRSAIAKASS